MKIIDYEKKQEMIPLSEEENKSYKEQETCHICKKNFCLDENNENENDENDEKENEKDEKFKKYRKVKET